MRSIRSSLLCAGALLLCAAAAPDEAEVRRAAAMLDYVARGYGAAVSDGRVVNAPEYDEQQAFAQEAGDILGRLAVGRPFVAEARALEELVRGKARAGAVAARAAALDKAVLEAAGLSTLPPIEVQPGRGRALYADACAACHGAEGRGDGPAAPGLSTPATDLTGKDRAELTPYGVYSAVTWGVPRTAMPAYESMSEQHRWEIALATLELGHSADNARRGEALARVLGLVDGRRALVAKSDAGLRADFAARGLSGDDARALLAWVRRIAPFAGPAPAGFPDLTTEVALSSVSYVQKRQAEAEDRLREAQLAVWGPLEPLVAPEKIGAVREGFATARERIAQKGPNERVLLAVAQLVRRIGEAGPEKVPAAPDLRAAGWKMALREGAPAALALAGAMLIAFAAGARPLLPVVLSVAGAGLGAAFVSGWPVSLALQWSASAAALAALLLWLARRRGALVACVAAALAAAAAAGEARRCCAALLRVFSDAPADMSRAAALAGAALAAVSILAALVLRPKARVLGAVALALAVASSALPAARRTQAARRLVPR